MNNDYKKEKIIAWTGLPIILLATILIIITPYGIFSLPVTIWPLIITISVLFFNADTLETSSYIKLFKKLMVIAMLIFSISAIMFVLYGIFVIRLKWF